MRGVGNGDRRAAREFGTRNIDEPPACYEFRRPRALRDLGRFRENARPPFTAIEFVCVDNTARAVDRKKPRDARLRGEVKERRESVSLWYGEGDRDFGEQGRRVGALNDLGQDVTALGAFVGQPCLREAAAPVEERDNVPSNEPARTECVARFVALDIDQLADARNEIDVEPEGRGGCGARHVSPLRMDPRTRACKEGPPFGGPSLVCGGLQACRRGAFTTKTSNGAYRDRTGNLCLAKASLSQLS